MNATPDTDRRSGATNLEVADDVAAALRTATRLVVPTDAADDALARAREATLSLARQYGFDVVLYDRSDERWTDTPHPTGPLEASAVDADERPHLVRQMHDFEAAGIHVQAWLATVPALTAVIDVFQELKIDGIVLPEDLGKPKVMDRIAGGSDIASMVERFAELQLPTPPIVLVVPESGPVSRINTEEKKS